MVLLKENKSYYRTADARKVEAVEMRIKAAAENI
jgi:hypothetical protein